MINSGDTHELGFGVDDLVKVERVDTGKRKGESGFVSTVNTDLREFKTTVTNLHDFDMKVEVIDRLPVSNHEDIEVEMTSGSSEPTIRDIPSLLALAPWYGKKHRDNTLTMKRFSNGRGFWCLGGKAAKNYREKSVDVAGYDELAAFDEDIEQEGSPTFLGDKRIEGSVWPKSIRGSTPKVRGTCQIERAASESLHFMRFHVAWPHCGEEQYLKFGDKETPFGLKWTPDDPSSVFYLCEHNACVIRQQELDFTDARDICEKTGIWTHDGILWFSSSGEEIELVPFALAVSEKDQRVWLGHGLHDIRVR